MFTLAYGTIIDGAGKTNKVIGFGPISVLPAYRSQDIGGALIKYSLDKARSLGFTAVRIYGDPRYDITNYEGKFAVALMTLEIEYV
jgi:putative acetyltransferase